VDSDEVYRKDEEEVWGYRNSLGRILTMRLKRIGSKSGEGRDEV